MKVELKLYKIFDADLMSLNSNGISISALVKTALYHYARGEIVRFHVPECKSFDLEGRRRFIHIIVNIDDPVSIDFLKNQLKYRQRTAFLRTLIRECLTTQQLGAFLKNDTWIKKETDRIHQINLTTMSNVVELEFNERKHDYASKIIKPAKISSSVTKDIKTKLEEHNEKIVTNKHSGSISALLEQNKNNDFIGSSQPKEIVKFIVPSEEIEENTGTKEVNERILEDESCVDTDMTEPFFDDEEEAPTLDDELFEQFQGFTRL